MMDGRSSVSGDNALDLSSDLGSLARNVSFPNFFRGFLDFTRMEDGFEDMSQLDSVLGADAVTSPALRSSRARVTSMSGSMKSQTAVDSDTNNNAGSRWLLQRSDNSSSKARLVRSDTWSGFTAVEDAADISACVALPSTSDKPSASSFKMRSSSIEDEPDVQLSHTRAPRLKLRSASVQEPQDSQPPGRILKTGGLPLPALISNSVQPSTTAGSVNAAAAAALVPDNKLNASSGLATGLPSLHQLTPATSTSTSQHNSKIITALVSRDKLQSSLAGAAQSANASELAASRRFAEGVGQQPHQSLLESSKQTAHNERRGILGFPSRVKVSQREMNMMSPSSF